MAELLQRLARAVGRHEPVLRVVVGLLVDARDVPVEERCPLGVVAELLDLGGEVVGGFGRVGPQQATAAVVEAVAVDVALPPPAVEDAVEAHRRPKLEVHEDVGFAVLRPVICRDSDEMVAVEAAVFVGRAVAVTGRRGNSSVLRSMRREKERGEVDAAEVGP